MKKAASDLWPELTRVGQKKAVLGLATDRVTRLKGWPQPPRDPWAYIWLLRAGFAGVSSGPMKKQRLGFVVIEAKLHFCPVPFHSRHGLTNSEWMKRGRSSRRNGSRSRVYNRNFQSAVS